jgi:hypothetical protein
MALLALPELRPCKVFLSYSSADRQFVRGLRKKLMRDGFDGWVDEIEIKPGEAFWPTIAHALDSNVSRVIAIISKNSVKSPWVQKELNLAMSREARDRQTLIIPMLIDSTPLPVTLTDKHYSDFRTPYTRSREYPALLRALRGA